MTQYFDFVRPGTLNRKKDVNASQDSMDQSGMSTQYDDALPVTHLRSDTDTIVAKGIKCANRVIDLATKVQF